MLRQALQKAVDKVREAEQRASRAIEHANQQMHATAQRAIEMQGEVNHHVNRAHAAQREAEMHQKNSLTHQAIAAQHAASLQETSQHLSALRSELEKVKPLSHARLLPCRALDTMITPPLPLSAHKRRGIPLLSTF